MLNHLKVTYSNTTPDNVEFMANKVMRTHLEATAIRSKPIKTRTELLDSKALSVDKAPEQEPELNEQQVSYDFVGVAG
ncbi:MAG: hypothetical protein V7784_09295 [Oceanospirillaceae bacterium]